MLDNSVIRVVNCIVVLRVLVVWDVVGDVSEHVGHDGVQVSDLREVNRSYWVPY